MRGPTSGQTFEFQREINIIKRLSKTKVVAAALCTIVIAVGAKDWFLANSPYTLAMEQAAEFEWEKTWFKQTQNIWNFQPGDTVNVYFTDGSIVTFTLTKDMSQEQCTGGKCQWAGSEPFDETKTTLRQRPRPANAKAPIQLPIPNTSLFPKGYNMTPTPTAQSNTYVPTGTVTVIQSPGGGGCDPKCPPKVN